MGGVCAPNLSSRAPVLPCADTPFAVIRSVSPGNLSLSARALRPSSLTRRSSRYDLVVAADDDLSAIQKEVEAITAIMAPPESESTSLENLVRALSEHHSALEWIKQRSALVKTFLDTR